MTTLTLPRVGIAFLMADGQLAPEWRRFLFDLTQRAGGVSGSGTDDLALSAFEDAGIEETKAQLISIRDEFSQLPRVPEQPEAPNLGPNEYLLAEIAALRSRIEGLEQR